MSDVITTLNGSLGQAIGWALVHLLWQATIIAIALGLAVRLLRNSSSNLRYTIAAGALVLTTLMPFATGYHVWQEAGGVPAVEAMEFDIAPLPVEKAAATPILVLKDAETASESESPTIRERLATLGESLTSALPTIVALWFVGVIILSTRLTISWVRIQSLMRSASIRAEHWNRVAADLSRRLGLRRKIEVFESALVDVPTVIGFVRPVILMPLAALTGLSPEQIETILAHELAHVRRQDYLVNLFQTVVETLFFYHPAVWWMSRQIRIEREHCCDDLAVEICGDPFAYARALTILEQMRPTAPAIALAATGGSLLARVRRLLGLRTATEPWPSSLVAGSILCTAILVAGLVITPLTTASESTWFDSDYEMTVTDEWGSETEMPDDPIEPLAFIEPPEPPDPPELYFFFPNPPMVPVPPVPPLAPTARVPAIASFTSMAIDAALTPMLAMAGDEYAEILESALEDIEWDLEDFEAELADFDVQLEDFDAEIADSWEDMEYDMANMGHGSAVLWGGRGADDYDDPIDFSSMDVEDLIAIKNHGITREWVETMEATGLGELSLGEAIRLKALNITPSYVEKMRKTFGDVDTNDLIRMKGVGVTPAFAEEMKDAGFDNADVDDLVRVRGVGVDPSYIDAMRKSLGSDLSIGDVIRLRGVGATPEYVATIRASGFEADASDIVRLRGAGVDAIHVARWRDAGFADLDVNDVVRLRGVGVTPEDVRAYRAAGLTDLDPNDLVRLRGVGVTPDYIRAMREAGISDVDASDLVRLRGVGVTPDYVRELREVGLDDLDANELIRLKGNGIDAEFIRDMKKK